MKSRIFVLATYAVMSTVVGSVWAEPSRCTLGETKFMSWAPRERPWTLKGGLLHLDAKPGEATTFQFNRKNDARFLAAFASGPAYRITFKYRSTAKASLICSGSTMDAPKDGSPLHREMAIPASDEWREFAWDAPAPQQDCENIIIMLRCAKGEGFIELSDPKVMMDDMLLGICVVILGVVAWGIINYVARKRGTAAAA